VNKKPNAETPANMTNVPEKEKKTMGRKHSFVVIEFGADIRMQEEEKWGGGCITCRAPFQ